MPPWTALWRELYPNHPPSAEDQIFPGQDRVFHLDGFKKSYYTTLILLADRGGLHHGRADTYYRACWHGHAIEGSPFSRYHPWRSARDTRIESLNLSTAQLQSGKTTYLRASLTTPVR